MKSFKEILREIERNQMPKNVTNFYTANPASQKKARINQETDQELITRLGKKADAVVNRRPEDLIDLSAMTDAEYLAFMHGRYKPKKNAQTR